MMDALIAAMEASLASFSLWAYNPHNTDSAGDDWNSENFSWYSDATRHFEISSAADGEEKQAAAGSPDTGGRLLDVIVRPYAIATAGVPLSHKFQPDTGLFTYRFRDVPTPPSASATPAPERVTEIFLPKRVYGEALRTKQLKQFMSEGGHYRLDLARQRMFVWFDDDARAVKAGTERIRRVDLWVKDPPEEVPVGIIVGVFIILAMSLFVLGSEVSRVKYGKAWVDLPLLAYERPPATTPDVKTVAAGLKTIATNLQPATTAVRAVAEL